MKRMRKDGLNLSEFNSVSLRELFKTCRSYAKYFMRTEVDEGLRMPAAFGRLIFDCFYQVWWKTGLQQCLTSLFNRNGCITDGVTSYPGNDSSDVAH